MLPVSAAFEMVFAALHAVSGRDGLQLSRVRVLGPVSMTRLRALRVVLDEGNTRFQVDQCSTAASGDTPEWRLLAAGKVSLADWLEDADPAGADVADPDQSSAAASGAPLEYPYERLRELGIELGPSLQRLEAVQLAGGRARAALGCAAASDSYFIDPTSIEAALALLVLSCGRGSGAESSCVAAIDRLQVLGHAARVERVEVSTNLRSARQALRVVGRSRTGQALFVFDGVRVAHGFDLRAQRLGAMALHVADLASDLLLGREVGAADDLVRLGMRSIDAVRLVSALQAELGCEVALSRVLERPRVDEIARLCVDNSTGVTQLTESSRPSPAREQGSDVPLSRGQEQLWFLEQLGDLGPAYNEVVALELEGKLDAGALCRALSAVVARHEVLRTCVHGEGAELRQRYLRPTLQVVEHRSITENDARAGRAVMLQQARAFARQPFDLTTGRVLRALLIENDSRSLLVLAAHHMVVDDWSLQRIVLPELAQFYGAELAGTHLSLGEAQQHASFVRWEQAHLRALVDRPGELSFWRQSLGDLPAVITLPTDRPRPSRIAYDGARHSLRLPCELTSLVESFAAQQGVTSFIVFLAAYELLLATYGRQDRFCVGVVAANRGRSEHEGLAGLLANLVAFRAEVPFASERATVAGFVQDVKRRAYAAIERQATPFSSVVNIVETAREPGANPLVQAVFAFEGPWPQLVLDGMSAQPLALDLGVAKFDLTLSVQAAAAEQPAKATFEYRVDLFSAATVASLAETFEWLLSNLCARPDGRLCDIDLVSPAAARGLLATCAGPEARVAQGNVHASFTERAAREPNRLAVSHATGSLDYATLDARSNRLAHWLLAQGVHIGAKVGAKVGVRLARGPELLVAVLGILKAGAAFVPFDRALPVRRALEMQQAAAITLTLAERDDAGELPGLCTDWLHASAACSSEAPAVTVPDDALAYVIYTSGSTGSPKGVAVEHRNVVNFFAAMDAVIDLEPRGVWLAITSLSFDISVLELLWTLTRGFRVVLHDGLAGAQELDAPADITHLQCTPSGARLLLAQASGRRLLGGLAHLLLGGEALSAELVRQIRAVCSARITNMYGPTETTVWSTSHEVRDAVAAMSIGKPLANTTVCIVDEQRRLLPRGAHGELWIAGAGVARGYLGAPARTDRRFLAVAFASDVKRRWYRSGDRARYRDDGTLEFLGRLDDQVKIRGHRVEPAEIERAVATHPAVAECAVVVHERLDQCSIVAYVAMRGEVDARVLRDAARELVPEVMVPHHFVQLAALPRGIGGKIDRAALRALPDPERPVVAPAAASPLELALARIWQRVLGASGLDDEFFALGGDSMSALRIVSMVRDELAEELSLRMLITHRTIASIAAALDRARTRAASSLSDTGGAPETRCVWLGAAAADAADTNRIEAAALAVMPAFEHPAVRAQLTELRATDRVTFPVRFDTPWGRIALGLLPLQDADLFRSQDLVIPRLREGLHAASQRGARAMALTGLLAASTDYGRALVHEPAGIPVTTGHAATCAAVVMMLRYVLQASGRDFSQERFAVLGVGSIGAGALCLALRSLPEPAEIVLCDVPARRARLSLLALQLKAAGARCSITLSTDWQAAESPLYGSSVIVGASSVPDVLDVARLLPGTIVVDDSAPHCFPVAQALARMREQRDVLLCEGGTVRAPAPIRCSVRTSVEPDALALRELDALLGPEPREIMACTLAALLPGLDPSLEPTLGEPTVESCAAHLAVLARLGVTHGPCRLGAYMLSDEAVASLVRRHVDVKPGA